LFLRRCSEKAGSAKIAVKLQRQEIPGKIGAIIDRQNLHMQGIVA
jgi:hypothetical protein